MLGNHALLLKWSRSVTIPAFSPAGPTGLHKIWWTLLIPYKCEGSETYGRTLPQYFTTKAAKAHELKWCSAGTWGFAVWVLTCFRTESQAAIWAKKQKKKKMPVHNNVFADSSTGRGLANKPTNSHNRKSVNEWEGAGRRAGLCWWKIWLLSTSAFLNTRSYLASPPEERSFLFFFSPLHHPALSLSSSPLPPSCSSLFSHFIYLPPSSPFIHFPPFIFFFCQHSPIFFFPIPLHPSPRSPLLPISHALNGTAHSATKQSCLQHHTLANQARPEFSSPQIHSTTLWYCAALEARGFSHEEDEREERRHGGVWDGWMYTGHSTEVAELKGLLQY